MRRPLLITFGTAGLLLAGTALAGPTSTSAPVTKTTPLQATPVSSQTSVVVPVPATQIAPAQAAPAAATTAPPAEAAAVQNMAAMPAAATSGPSMPVRGMDMANVEHIFGAPLEKLSAVPTDATKLHPPITRWEYPGYVVYFEYNFVVHTVVKKHPLDRKSVV